MLREWDLSHKGRYFSLAMGEMSHYPGQMLTSRHLATLAEAYVSSGKMSLTGLGKSVCNDHRFFKRLVAGRDCTTESADKAARWFVANWPADLAWPAGVPRQPSLET